MKERTLSIGGSLLFKEGEVRSNYIREIAEVLKNFYNCKFHIIVGGGDVCRTYQKALREVGETDNYVIDKMGIEITHINAKLLAYALKTSISSEVNYHSNPRSVNKEAVVTVTGGTEPGHTTDHVAIELAMLTGSDVVLNFTNVGGVLRSENGRLTDDIISHLSWDEYLSMVPNDHSPGINLPFCPEGAKLAQKNNITVKVLNGNNVINIANCLNECPFIGTTIS